ncbi:regulator of nucleoside diphosphate kinase [Stella humosa]|uniref:Regulator of nucleoside diphosphate kinase n=1 Tax=Stella humosa TaxID=94 RepID=A0A3N1KRG4_9PROT|nr:nucleoside diphosphate kinase regulator [Stella humosa]ROP83191.1 regulator of nucleoside diphosphate kinase [Stella humosa]BBK30030.1 nucleoside diphosphate kinase regulator [Stella humosa]
MTTPRRGQKLPPITVRQDDHQTLNRLADGYADSMPEVSEYLIRELDRARVVKATALPADVVAMGSSVRFRDDVTRQERTVTLVYPGEQDIEQGRVSVMTPIGAALIGVARGHSIAWETRRGESRALTVLEVEPAAVAG